MNLRFYAVCTAILLALGVPVLPVLGVPFLEGDKITATVHGATYASDTLEPLNDTLININSNPPQSIVAKNGVYSFELAPGDYIITARCYRNNTLIYLKETTLEIEGEGNYVFDLLLHPVSGYPETDTIADKMSNLNRDEPIGQARVHSSIIRYLPVALVLFLLLGGGYKLSRKRKKPEKNRFQSALNIPWLLAKVFDQSINSGVRSKLGSIEKTVSVTEPLIGPADNFGIETTPKKSPLSADLSEILDIIRGHKGRITQKDLRGRLEYSEVEVSLMLSELEKRGLIRKLKNGRENIVVLADKNNMQE
jgi:uncharacterized membrane protein